MFFISIVMKAHELTFCHFNLSQLMDLQGWGRILRSLHIKVVVCIKVWEFILIMRYNLGMLIKLSGLQPISMEVRLYFGSSFILNTYNKTFMKNS